MNDITIQFAILWGQTIGHAAHSNDPNEVALGAHMKEYDSMELMGVFYDWQQEYSKDKDLWDYDTVNFFENKIDDIQQKLLSQQLTR